MKKFISILLFVVMLTTVAFGATGDIAGNYYATDIATFLNGFEIDSINIGGQTLISAEDMLYYSFSVRWDANERTLYINEADHATNGEPPKVVAPRGDTIEKPLGYYYETDIVTKLDGYPATSFNIGGRTYIHAEEMANLGYLVKWDGDLRKLSITSPKRAGYTYTIPMTDGTEKKTEGTGSFSVVYSDGKVMATGDADYFSSSISLRSNGEYGFNMAFYQNLGLFYSLTLQDKLEEMTYYAYGQTLNNPEDKYEIINKNLTFSINGSKATKIKIEKSGGNGHVDYVIIASGLPRIKKSEIKEIKISIGDVAGEEYEIKPRENKISEISNVAEMLKKYEEDFMQAYFSTENYYLVFMYESPKFGVVYPKLYLVNRENFSASEDILEGVKAFDGFNYENLSPFAFKEGTMKERVYFSCTSDIKVGDFYFDISENKVHLISSSDR